MIVNARLKLKLFAQSLLLLLVSGTLGCQKSVGKLIPNKEFIRLNEPVTGFQENTFIYADAQMMQSTFPDGPIQAAVLSIARNNILVFEKAYGRDGEGNPLKRDALFDVASLTKPMATASSVAVLVCRGEIDLAEDLAGYSVEECLTHETKLPQNIEWNRLDDQDLNLEILTEYLLSLPQEPKAGYSNSAYVLLGALVEQRTNRSLADVASKDVFSPLGMNNTNYLPNREGIYLLPESEGPRLLPLVGIVVPSASDQALGRPYDPLADFLVTSLRKAPAHSGLFTSAGDVSRFSQGLLQPPTSELACVAALLLEPTQTNRTLGFNQRADGSLEQTGFTGCLIWIDPATKTSVSLLTNQTLTHAEPEWLFLKEEIIRIVSRGILPDFEM